MAVNYGVCDKCKSLVPASYEVRDNRVHLVKTCSACGKTDALVSNDSRTWQRKRDIWQFDPEKTATCDLACTTCGHPHHPRLVFLDLTNRCNMNCPICVANAPWMGFDFHPPMAYFLKVFEALAAMTPKPVVHFFGGEPTLRSDLFELFDACHKLGLRVHLVTNGLKLADEDFCRRVCERKVPVFLGFDGRSPDIYARMRKSPGAYEKKLQALENLKKFSQHRQNVIMCCTARHINDHLIADLFALAYEHRSHIKGIQFLPLTETWEPGRFEPGISTTMEDVEQIVADAFTEEKVEYVSLGLQHHFGRALSVFQSGAARTFSGVHPNCEAATLFFPGDGRYLPVSHFLKRPLPELAEEAVKRAKRIDARLAQLGNGGGFSRLRARLLVVRTFYGLVRDGVRVGRLTKGSPWLAIPRLIGGLIMGKTLGEQLEKHTILLQRLTSIILPFEELHSVESQRMRMCGAGFAYEDVDTGEIKTIPACTWWLYNKPILKKIAEKYAAAPSA